MSENPTAPFYPSETSRISPNLEKLRLYPNLEKLHLDPNLENDYETEQFEKIDKTDDKAKLIYRNRDSNPLIDEVEKLKIENFINEKKVLEDLLFHYKKLKFKYTQIDSALKTGGILITGVLGLGTAVMTSLSTFGIGLLIYIPVGTAIFSTVNLFITETISVGITSKRKKIYREICEAIEHSIDKLYLFQMKALEDKKLSYEEIEQAKKIIQACKENIKKIKEGNVLEKVNKVAKKELKQELKNNIKKIKEGKVLEVKKEHRDKLIEDYKGMINV